MVARRKGEFQKLGTDEIAGGEPTEKASIEQILLRPASGLRNLRLGPDGALVLEQTLQDADGGVKRGANSAGRFAVPTSIRKLLVQETAREGLGGPPEIRAQREPAAVDARLYFALEKPVAAEFCGTQVPGFGIVPPQRRFELRQRRGHRRFGGIHPGGAQEQQREKGR